jgi:hypothetical protein
MANVLVTYNHENTDAQTLKLAAEALNEYGGFHHAYAGKYDYQHIDTNISVRDSYSRSDYNYFRPGERKPKDQKAKIALCMEAYKNIGLIRNVIDMMSDFGANGVQLTHPNPKIQKFYRGWFKRVNGPQLSERFLNLLYRAGNVPVKRTMSKINKKYENYFRALATDKLKSDSDNPPIIETSSYIYPSAYTILNPLSLSVGGGALAQFTGKKIYLIEISSELRRQVITPRDEAEKLLVASLPQDILKIIQGGAKYIPIPDNRLSIFFYKKDDWQNMADPMTASILNDLTLLEKMQLADLAALDGVISQIRLWKLGDKEKGIYPTQNAVAKLSDILLSNPGGGVFDIIWGPDIEMDTYESKIYQFLGKTKYEPILNNIYAGLGISQSLSGGKGGGGANYVTLKALTERLKYGRELLTEFWEQEIELVRQAMGFKFGAKVRFDRMILTDEAAERALMIQLVDRGYMSFETINERFGEDATLEELRLYQEYKRRKSGELVPQGGPYYDPQQLYTLTKIALQRALITPKEAGVDVKEQYTEPPFMTQMHNRGVGSSKDLEKTLTGVPQQGRPIGVKDSQPRTRKSNTGFGNESIAQLITLTTWSKSAMQSISELINKAMFKVYNIKSAREFTTEQSKAIEYLKFTTLSYIKPYDNNNYESYIYKVMSEKKDLPQEYKQLYGEFSKNFINSRGREPNTEENRSIYAGIYAWLNI